MPTYEYRCPHCGHEFERHQKASSRWLGKCPKCKKRPQRLISAGTCVIFKGSGFYCNDYGRKT